MWTASVHIHGSLAGMDLVSNASALPNHYSREIPLTASHAPVSYSYDPVRAHAMGFDEIQEFRRWHREAAIRARHSKRIAVRLPRDRPARKSGSA